MGTGGLQGWHADPFQRHEARYFSVGRPTELVRDGYAVSYDEPPSWWARRGRGLGKAAGAVLLAGAVVAAVLAIVGRSGPAPAVTLLPGVLLPQSAQRTLTQRTADVTVTGEVQAQGSIVKVEGSGEADFSTGSMAVNAVVSLPSGALAETEIGYDGTLFYSVSVTRPPGSLPEGRSWIQMPAPQSSSASLTGSDPLTALRQLAAEGNTVRSLGMKTIGGVTCGGYAVTPRLAPAQTVTAWIDSQHLVREEDAAVTMTINGAAAAGTIVMNFSNFGVPVQIVPPAGSDIIAYGAVSNDVGLSSLANLSGTGTAPVHSAAPPPDTTYVA
jgi:hypothetical protein